MARRDIDFDLPPPTETGSLGSPGSLVVGLDCRSMNLYRFLRVRFPTLPRSTLQGWLSAGKVQVNGSLPLDSTVLRTGDIVEIDAPVARVAQRRKPTRFEVLHQDTSMLVVDKPAGLATVTERSGDSNHLLEMLRQRLTPECGSALRLVHRLDKQASGVVVFALHRTAKQRLVEEFTQRRVIKDYLALVSGRFPEEPLVCVAALTPLSTKPPRMGIATGRRGKWSCTLFRRRFLFRGYSLVHARPITGRTHQIRVHLRHLGHAIVGDTTYGGEPRLLLSRLKQGYRPGRGEEERPLLDRLALHATRIRLRSPEDGNFRTFEGPLPKDLRAAFHQLGKLSLTPEETQVPGHLLTHPLGLADDKDPFDGLVVPDEGSGE